MNMRSGKIKKIILIILLPICICILTLLIEFFIGFGIFNSLQYENKKSEYYTPENWKRVKPTDRYIYLESLNSQYELLGKDSSSIIELMGVPDNKDYYNSNKYRYLVKHDSWWGPLYFEIYFHDDIVYDYKLEEDG